MNAKRPTITAAKPTPQQADPADGWVKTRGTRPPREETTRMTFDLAISKHHAFRMATARNNKKFTQVLREFVDSYIAESEARQ